MLSPKVWCKSAKMRKIETNFIFNVYSSKHFDKRSKFEFFLKVYWSRSFKLRCQFSTDLFHIFSMIVWRKIFHSRTFSLSKKMTHAREICFHLIQRHTKLMLPTHVFLRDSRYWWIILNFTLRRKFARAVNEKILIMWKINFKFWN